MSADKPGVLTVDSHGEYATETIYDDLNVEQIKSILSDFGNTRCASDVMPNLAMGRAD